MKKLVILLALCLLSFETASAQEARNFTTRTECYDAGGYCVHARNATEAVVLSTACPNRHQRLGLCPGTATYYWPSSCCRLPNGPAFRSEAECNTAGGSEGAFCNRQSESCGNKTRLGWCAWDGYTDSLSACCSNSTTSPAPYVAPLSYGDYKLLEQIPGSSNTSGQLQPYLESIYKAGLVLIVLGAIVMIGFGGFIYMASAGNTAMIKKGKGLITDALIGLVVALCIWLILNIINPDLIRLQINPLPRISFDANNTGATAAANNTAREASERGVAISCPEPLIAVPSEFALKGGPNQICPSLLSKLTELKRATPNSQWRITRTMGGGAQSTCHRQGQGRDGSCADIAINPNPGFNNQAWDTLCRAASSISGINVLNEASNSSGCVSTIGRFTPTVNQTGAHLHINLIGN